MVFFSIIGIVILFYKWATGKAAGTTEDSPGDADVGDD